MTDDCQEGISHVTTSWKVTVDLHYELIRFKSHVTTVKRVIFYLNLYTNESRAARHQDDVFTENDEECKRKKIMVDLSVSLMVVSVVNICYLIHSLIS